MEIETHKRTIHFLHKENQLMAIKYRNEEQRYADIRSEVVRSKKHFDASSNGQLHIENNKLSNKLAECTDRLAERAETIKQLQRKVVKSEKRQIEKERKQMLKIELMAKTHFKPLRNNQCKQPRSCLIFVNACVVLTLLLHILALGTLFFNSRVTTPRKG